MSIPKLKKQFLEVSDALDLGNPSIPEKDYWVVSLLAMLEDVKSENHLLVFSGGTALAKSNIKILRMSEDVDIKLIPTDEFIKKGKGAKKKARKVLIEKIIMTLADHPYLNYADKKVNDEYRYVEIEIKYPQQYHQAPCLRPMFDSILEEDRIRLGNQHQEFVDDPRNELKLGLVELKNNEMFRERFNALVAPMVYNSKPHNFDTCIASFKLISERLIINTSIKSLTPT